MSVLLLVEPLLKLLQLHILTIIANHLFNIPLSLFLGLGKYVAFAIAVVMDAVQLVIYYNVLNNTKIGKRFGWTVDKELVKDYKKPKFMSRLHHSWLYIGVMFLSLLPVYFGGLFVSVFTAHTLKLNKTKSLICICIGSLLGCMIWTIGIWNLIDLIIHSIRHHI